MAGRGSTEEAAGKPRTRHSRRYPSCWDEEQAAGLTPLHRLAYRSNLLGADRRLANWSGGNTSSKLDETDHLGRTVRVLWVKGSGTDLATIGPGGFSALRLEELLALRERDALRDDEMIDHLLRSGINPDAVIAGPGIWTSDWRRARAVAYGIDESELEAHYRSRTTLKVSVYPEDVAETVLFFASPRSAKTTGNILNVDGGVAAAFPR